MIIIDENGESMLKDEHIKKIEKYLTEKDSKVDVFQDLVQNGIIEYLDVNESENCNIALNEKFIHKI